MGLTLVKSNTFKTVMFSELILQLRDLLEPSFEISYRMYGTTGTKLNLWEIENTSNGICIRFVYDPDKTQFNRQGIHHELTEDDDGHSLCELLDQADRDSFDTIWIH